MLIRLLILMLCAAMVPSAAAAQAPYNLSSPVRNLATLFTDLYGPNGLIVDSEATLPGEQPHSAHFNSDFQADFSQFSTALVGQIVSVPLPSPASGFTYRFDSTLGVFQRTTQSFGPILTERAETIGAGRFAFGFAAQRFTFDTVEGLDLHTVPAVFTHDNAQLLGGRQDVVTTTNSIKATVNQSTTFMTYGVTDRFDVSVAVPIVSNTLEVVSDATIQRLGTDQPADALLPSIERRRGDSPVVHSGRQRDRPRRHHRQAQGHDDEGRVERVGRRPGRAHPDGRPDEPARNGHDRRAAVLGLVGHVSEGLAAPQRQLHVEWIQRSGRQPATGVSRRIFRIRSDTPAAWTSA